VEFRYAGGDARTYRVPVWQYGMRHDGSGTSGWRYSGLDRLFAEHLALPDHASSRLPVHMLHRQMAENSTPSEALFRRSHEISGVA